MKRILVFGLTKTVGGVESYIRNLIYNIDLTEYFFDFLIVGEEEKACFEDEFNEFFNDGINHFYHCPNMKKGFISTNRWLKEFYQSHHYDLIYMNVTTAARIMYCNYAVTKQGVPLITHNHCGNAVSKWASINNNLFRGYTTRKSAVKLACSDEAFTYGFTCDKSEGMIIKNGIDVNRFAFDELVRTELRAELGIMDNQIVVGHIGRFAIEKNQKFFIDLSKELGERYVFVCVGDGELKDEFYNDVRRNNLEKQFRILPFSRQAEKYYSVMDVFAMPSLYEGLPLVAVEAQAAGLPCVFSDTISRQSDICGHSVYVSIKNKDSWIEAIKETVIKRYDNIPQLTRAGYNAKTTGKMITTIFKETKKEDDLWI